MNAMPSQLTPQRASLPIRLISRPNLTNPFGLLTTPTHLTSAVRNPFASRPLVPSAAVPPHGQQTSQKMGIARLADMTSLSQPPQQQSSSAQPPPSVVIRAPTYPNRQFISPVVTKPFIRGPATAAPQQPLNFNPAQTGKPFVSSGANITSITTPVARALRPVNSALASPLRPQRMPPPPRQAAPAPPRQSAPQYLVRQSSPAVHSTKSAAPLQKTTATPMSANIKLSGETAIMNHENTSKPSTAKAAARNSTEDANSSDENNDDGAASNNKTTDQDDKKELSLSVSVSANTLP